MSEQQLLEHGERYTPSHEQPHLPDYEAERELGGRSLHSMVEFNPALHTEMPADEVPHDTAGSDGAQSPVAESAEAVEIPEQEQPSSEKIADAFRTAQRTVSKIQQDGNFRAWCEHYSVDPNDTGKPAYWAAVAGYTQSRVADLSKKVGNPLQLRALELISATPDYLFQQAIMSQHRHSDFPGREHSRTVASRYNALIRDFALDFPETRADDMAVAMQDSALLSIENDMTRHIALKEVHGTIRGAQHELAFGQILEYTGLPFRPARLDEDLVGIDYVMNEGANTSAYIDVKSSVFSIKEYGRHAPGKLAVTDRHGKITMHSLIEDGELNGKFFISDEAAQAKARKAYKLIRKQLQPELAYSSMGA